MPAELYKEEYNNIECTAFFSDGLQLMLFGLCVVSHVRLRYLRNLFCRPITVQITAM